MIFQLDRTPNHLGAKSLGLSVMDNKSQVNGSVNNYLKGMCVSHPSLGWGPGLDEKEKESPAPTFTSLFDDCGCNVPSRLASAAYLPYHNRIHFLNV